MIISESWFQITALPSSLKITCFSIALDHINLYPSYSSVFVPIFLLISHACFCSSSPRLSLLLIGLPLPILVLLLPMFVFIVLNENHLLIASGVVCQTMHNCCDQWEKAHAHVHVLTQCGRSVSFPVVSCYETYQLAATVVFIKTVSWCV